MAIETTAESYHAVALEHLEQATWLHEQGRYYAAAIRNGFPRSLGVTSMIFAYTPAEYETFGPEDLMPGA